jgi:hypothetical protein
MSLERNISPNLRNFGGAGAGPVYGSNVITNVPVGAGAGTGPGADPIALSRSTRLIPLLVNSVGSESAEEFVAKLTKLNLNDFRESLRQGYIKNDLSALQLDLPQNALTHFYDYFLSICKTKPFDIENETNLFQDKLINLLPFLNIKGDEVIIQINKDLTRDAFFLFNNESKIQLLEPNYFDVINKLSISKQFKQIIPLITSQNLGNTLIASITPYIMINFNKLCNNPIGRLYRIIINGENIKFIFSCIIPLRSLEFNSDVFNAIHYTFNCEFNNSDDINNINFNIKTKNLHLDNFPNKINDIPIIVSSGHSIINTYIFPIIEIKNEGHTLLNSSVIYGRDLSSDNTIRSLFENDFVNDLHPYLAYLLFTTVTTSTLWNTFFDGNYKSFVIPTSLKEKQISLLYFILCSIIGKQNYKDSESTFYKKPNSEKISELLTLFPLSKKNYSLCVNGMKWIASSEKILSKEEIEAIFRREKGLSNIGRTPLRRNLGRLNESSIVSFRNNLARNNIAGAGVRPTGIGPGGVRRPLPPGPPPGVRLTGSGPGGVRRPLPPGPPPGTSGSTRKRKTRKHSKKSKKFSRKSKY